MTKYWWLEQFSSLPTTETIKQIERFRELPDGWHYGRGVAPSEEAAKLARTIVLRGAQWGLPDSDAMPGANGEIQVGIYYGDSYLEFTIEPNGLIDYRREEEDLQVAAENRQSLRDALSILKNFAAEAWLLSGRSTASTTPHGRVDLASWHSRTMKAFPLSTSTVQLEQAVQYADT